jgi:hypothetical protein
MQLSTWEFSTQRYMFFYKNESGMAYRWWSAVRMGPAKQSHNVSDLHYKKRGEALSNICFCFAPLLRSVEKNATVRATGMATLSSPGGHGHAGRAVRPQTLAHSGWQGHG